MRILPSVLQHRRLPLLLLGLVMLASCSASRSATAPAHEAIPQPTLSLPASPSPPLPTGIVATIAPAPLVLLRNEQDVYLKASTGQVAIAGWIDATHLIAFWSGDAREDATYLVDLAAGQLKQLVANHGQPQIVAQPDAGRAVLVWEASMDVAVLDLPVGTLQTVFARDPTVPQWATASEQRWDFGDGPISFAVTWMPSDTFVLTLTPPDRNAPDWGKLLLVDRANQRVQLLTEAGQLAAILPDGGILVRHGWVDGALQLMTPPYANVTTEVAPGGLWTWGWAVSPDSQHVAWLEWTPPPGDWSQRLPQACCSADPQPTVHALVVWDRSSGQIQRFPLTGLRWPTDLKLRWRTDGAALLLTGAALDNPNHTALFEFALNGQLAMLASHPWVGTLTITFVGNDGSIYYIISGQRGQNDSELVRRTSDGKLDVVCDGIPLSCALNQAGLLTTKQAGTLTIEDLNTGVVQRLAVAHAAQLSPDGGWIVAGSPGSKIHLSSLPNRP